MVQASHARKGEFDYNYGFHTNQQATEKRIKRVYKKSHPGKRVLVKAGIAAFAYAVIMVYLCITISNMGYQKVHMEKDIEKMQAANHMLEFKIAEQISLDKVEMIAVAQLGMTRLDSGRRIAVTAYKPEPVQVAVQNPVQNDAGGNTSIGERSLHKLYSNLMLLAEKR